MSKEFNEYLERVQEINELQLKPNELEVAGDNVFGTLSGTNLNKYSAQQLMDLFAKSAPTVMKAIEDAGGIESIKGTDDKPDIRFTQGGEVNITPDSRSF